VRAVDLRSVLIQESVRLEDRQHVCINTLALDLGNRHCGADRFRNGLVEFRPYLEFRWSACCHVGVSFVYVGGPRWAEAPPASWPPDASHGHRVGLARSALTRRAAALGRSGSTWRGPQPSGEDTGRSAALGTKSRSGQAVERTRRRSAPSMTGGGRARGVSAGQGGAAPASRFSRSTQMSVAGSGGRGGARAPP